MDCEQTTQLLASDDEEQNSQKAPSRYRGYLGKNSASEKLFLTISLALILSILCNVILFTSSGRSWKSPICCKDQPSAYAGLSKTQDLTQLHNTGWWGLNETLSEQLWATIKTEQGMVALPNEFTDSRGLPRGVAFPWDTSKSVYFLQAYHTLHCLKMLHTSVFEARHGRRQSMNYWHLAHCLDSMRQDAMCTVDDTPRNLVPPPHGSTGHGLVRQCRDFEQLDAWTRERTACYTFPTDDEFHDPLETRFLDCPEGSAYLPMVEEYLKSQTLAAASGGPP